MDFLVEQENPVLQRPEQFVVVAVQHLLETTGTLIQTILELGLAPEHFFAMGKYYSVNQDVEERLRAMGVQVFSASEPVELGTYRESHEKDCARLWLAAASWMKEREIKTVIVMDDGGTLINSVPENVRQGRSVVGIEQTTSGIELNRGESIPVISVAESAVKRYVEPAFISQAVIQKMRMYLLRYAPKRIGVVGYGNIGRALVSDLRRGYSLEVWDINPNTIEQLEGVHVVSSVNELFAHCDMIIGATGRDISSEAWLRSAPSDKVLVSASSGDVEFRTLLRGSFVSLQDKLSALDAITLRTTTGHYLKILRGGTPINFDNNIHSVLPEHIQLTRALLLAGVIQAVANAQNLIRMQGAVRLDPERQRQILQWWMGNVDHKNFEFAYPLAQLLSGTFMEKQSGGVVPNAA